MSTRHRRRALKAVLVSSEQERLLDLFEATLRRMHMERNSALGMPSVELFGSLFASFGGATNALNALREPLQSLPDAWPYTYGYMLHLAAVIRADVESSGGVNLNHAPVHVMYAAWAADVFVTSGCPTLKLCDDVASALALSDTDADVVPRELPWPAFSIRLPPDVFWYDWDDAQGGPRRRVSAHRMLVAHRQDLDELYVILVNDDGDIPFVLSIVPPGKRLSLLYNIDAADPTDAQMLSNHRLALNLLAGVLLLVESGDVRKLAAPKKKKGARRWRTPGALPETMDYLVGSDVKLRHPEGFTELLRNVANGRRFGKLQWLVRGHERWQACGPGHSERKKIWIQPFWKGPVDAPILRRGYALGAQ